MNNDTRELLLQCSDWWKGCRIQARLNAEEPRNGAEAEALENWEYEQEKRGKTNPALSAVMLSIYSTAHCDLRIGPALLSRVLIRYFPYTFTYRNMEPHGSSSINL